jgi:hypothetical protein
LLPDRSISTLLIQIDAFSLHCYQFADELTCVYCNLFLSYNQLDKGHIHHIVHIPKRAGNRATTDKTEKEQRETATVTIHSEIKIDKYQREQTTDSARNNTADYSGGCFGDCVLLSCCGTLRQLN